ncbi:SPX domain-containing protein [Mycena maculata]|uniref:SPX domain-containing protein n=1 Tax=Mycena maculata TaxID=230809 RepID=A0AAD7N045_9AGAR|nr:SPX domain-containing protein [Mycena maculata]
MKFARYLEDTQTPEWQRAYIDYRLLKKRITAIRRAKETPNIVQSPISTEDENPGLEAQASAIRSVASFQPMGSSGSLKIPLHHEATNVSSPQLVPTISSGSNQISPHHEATNVSSPQLVPSPSNAQRSRLSLHRSQTLPAPPSVHSQPRRGRAPSFSHMFSSSRGSGRFTKLVGPQPHPYSELPLHDLMPLLSPLEREFFTTLDAELLKIETFYVAREQDMQMHTKLLEHQLNELDEHRNRFYAAYPYGAWKSAINTGTILKLTSKLLSEEQAAESAASHVKAKGKATIRKAAGKISGAGASSNQKLDSEPYETVHGTVRLDPDEYYSAKHKLKKAVLEHYRGLETLQNYRILNITGIRKALKKFQKVTKVDGPFFWFCLLNLYEIAAQNAYMTEKASTVYFFLDGKVDTAAFASEVNVKSMIDDMEEMYATRFAHGDKKKAMDRLRSGGALRYQQSTRDAIPGWDALLLVYSIFLIPVLFSLLVGLNLLVWTHSRINYPFIFEFDSRTRLDHREYFQTPSILMATLCYAFWLSFARIGASSFDPTLWPVVWLGFTAAIMLDPLPILFKPSRYWLLKNVGKLLTSGTRRVEHGVYAFQPLSRGVSDFLMDWSILSLHVKYPLLRKELVYSNHIYCYYFAILSNTLIRFVWVIYIPTQGPDPVLRSFIAGILEMLRRWQWNFYRVENEHLGNVDQYRVTREVPLPYSLDDPREDDGDDDEDGSPSRNWFPQRAIRLRRKRTVIEV